MATRNAIVVLDDGETYGLLSGCVIKVLSDEGMRVLNKYGDIGCLDPKHVVNTVSLPSLITSKIKGPDETAHYRAT